MACLTATAPPGTLWLWPGGPAGPTGRDPTRGGLPRLMSSTGGGLEPGQVTPAKCP